MPRILIIIILSHCMLLTSCGFTGYGARTTDIFGQKPTYYTVRSGDTLYSIANRHNTTVINLALLNGIRDPSRIEPGLTLLVGYLANGSNDYTIGHAKLTPVAYQGNKIEFTSGKLHWPVAQGTLSSNFGPRRKGFHDGIDIAAPPGTPIYAAHDGKIVYSDNKLGGYGNLVIIRGSDGITTIYAHNRRNLVRLNEQVKRGQKVAELGSTGRSTGPHLHFEVRIQDRANRYLAVDPLAFFNQSNLRKAHYRPNQSLNPIIAGPRQ